MSTDVDLATLESVARTLRSGGQGVEEMGAAPTGVDAGEMTGVVVEMLHRVTANAATLAEGLHNAATAVSDSHESYGATDTGTASRFGTPGRQ